jgi:hypothetical protein
MLRQGVGHRTGDGQVARSSILEMDRLYRRRSFLIAWIACETGKVGALGACVTLRVATRKPR